ncbi:MAG: O-antigen polysaccharide polymerase Wzy family protein [Paludibacter sp.]|nr:O-antigen polysaccharide polymerase Wzy family protein [Bacteroidales bacterium]MCM1069883.1 O-antigen polysaccharide polymerase Wzy family protein [Prevotella sp.]MCM1354564.1 O-antigen polysaccharide polymerase Wzy family protein [Bacteroides sp.]MCM1443459.1 O-antigen polysaccharide polymerase Wzy family protein [Muribaculum sp.]MCM1482543.1 O-antigen polysaccharide polymerase Wzy family protein [Paludibacter sp.]
MMVHRKYGYIAVSVLLLAVSLLILHFEPLTDWGYSLLMCINFVWVLLSVWKTAGLSPFFLFMCCFTFLFIGGRFWAELFLPNDFELRRGNFFDESHISDSIWIPALSYIVIFLQIATITYIHIRHFQSAKPMRVCNTNQPKYSTVNIVLLLIGCLLTPLVLHDIISQLTIAIEEGDYLSLYMGQTEDISAGSGIISSLLYVFFGIAFVYGNRYVRLLFFCLVFVKSLAFLIIGQRSKFGMLLLFIFWYYCKDKNIKLKHIGVFALFALFILIWLPSLSIRAISMGDNDSPLHMLLQFFYSQGVSLTTFTYSLQVSDYPTLAYFVTFLPGVATIASLFAPLPAVKTSFANHLAYTLDATLFEEGMGLGWTAVSDLYVHAGRISILFILLTILFALCCAKIENKSESSTFASTIIFVVFLNFTYLPRSGFYTIIPLIVYTYIIYMGLFRIIKIDKQLVWKNNI